MSNAPTTNDVPRLYDGDGDDLIQADRLSRPERILLLPHGDPREPSNDRDRIRIQWGQSLLADLGAGRYRAVVCGVNDTENAHGILGQLLETVPTSQWSIKTATSYAKVFQQSVSVHAADDREPYILKYDLDTLLILAILRPKDRDHFTLKDIRRGFSTVTKMLANRRDRMPVASVSFLGAKSNRLLDEDGREPSFESVLRTMHESGFRGDVYPSLPMWGKSPTGAFATYPFPTGLEEMRIGGH
ncbi:MAG: hypothetical protein AB8G96_13920 [Phycisphaerales bacterium]